MNPTVLDSPGYLLAFAFLCGVAGFRVGWLIPGRLALPVVQGAFGWAAFALAWTAARHAVASVDKDSTDAAKLEGASRWQMFRLVVWPQVGPQMFAAWYVVYMLCLWDVESIVLVQPPGGETLALKIFNLLHYGAEHLVCVRYAFWKSILVGLSMLAWPMVLGLTLSRRIIQKAITMSIKTSITLKVRRYNTISP